VAVLGSVRLVLLAAQADQELLLSLIQTLLQMLFPQQDHQLLQIVAAIKFIHLMEAGV
jgi:hypothetical protein